MVKTVKDYDYWDETDRKINECKKSKEDLFKSKQLSWDMYMHKNIIKNFDNMGDKVMDMANNLRKAYPKNKKIKRLCNKIVKIQNKSYNEEITYQKRREVYYKSLIILCKLSMSIRVK